MIDLRSDTVTQPTDRMREAMLEAEVGDDVFGEDPTTNALQDRIADLLGKEAALFVPSGVMGNQLAVKVLTRPGDEVILERTSHIFNYESGAPAVLSGVQLHVVDGKDGMLSAHDVRSAVRPGAYWNTRSRLLCLENTMNMAGGRVFPLDALHATAAAAQDAGLRLHLDGARLWNATAATGIAERAYAEPFDTVSVCLSKGLGAPVGSVLAGTATLIDEARRYRKMLGGGMRQTGMLAAAGLYALEHHRPLLGRDHDMARRLAEGLAAIDAFRIDAGAVETNIVLFDVVELDPAEVLETLACDGLRMVPFGATTIRATLHRDVPMEDVDRAIDIMQRRFGR